MASRCRSHRDRRIRSAKTSTPLRARGRRRPTASTAIRLMRRNRTITAQPRPARCSAASISPGAGIIRARRGAKATLRIMSRTRAPSGRAIHRRAAGITTTRIEDSRRHCEEHLRRSNPVFKTTIARLRQYLSGRPGENRNGPLKADALTGLPSEAKTL